MNGDKNCLLAFKIKAIVAILMHKSKIRLKHKYIFPAKAKFMQSKIKNKIARGRVGL